VDQAPQRVAAEAHTPVEHVQQAAQLVEAAAEDVAEAEVPTGEQLAAHQSPSLAPLLPPLLFL
jgi:D-alanyl-D-alanine carboxypeptidase